MAMSSQFNFVCESQLISDQIYPYYSVLLY